MLALVLWLACSSGGPPEIPAGETRLGRVTLLHDAGRYEVSATFLPDRAMAPIPLDTCVEGRRRLRVGGEALDPGRLTIGVRGERHVVPSVKVGDRAARGSYGPLALEPAPFGEEISVAWTGGAPAPGVDALTSGTVDEALVVPAPLDLSVHDGAVRWSGRSDGVVELVISPEGAEGHLCRVRDDGRFALPADLVNALPGPTPLLGRRVVARHHELEEERWLTVEAWHTDRATVDPR